MLLFENASLGAKFGMSDTLDKLRSRFTLDNYLYFIWNNGLQHLSVLIDGEKHPISPSTIMCCTHVQQLDMLESESDYITLMFNREFYCVHTLDHETSCNGLLFYGTKFSPELRVEKDEESRLKTLVGVLKEEFETKDINQEEMLKILLKRFIIRCTRLARNQLNLSAEETQEYDIIRHFSVLVEEHYKTKKTVVEYARLLNKSPKTISNIFSKFTDTTPLGVIHDRIILEAKRMLYYTPVPVKEVGIELGYLDPAQFSKFFKNQTGKTITEFRLSADRIHT
jgi:AraC-like DNA-binding protein